MKKMICKDCGGEISIKKTKNGLEVSGDIIILWKKRGCIK